MNKLRKQSDTTYPLFFLMVDSTDHVTGKTGLSPTVTISKNGGSFASPSGAVSEVGNGLYKIAGNATDSNTVGELWIHATGTGADPTDTSYTVVAYDPFDAVRLGLTALPNAAAEAAGGLYTRGSGAGQINQPANGQIDANTVKVGGTVQTARDIGASVLLSSGTGTGQVDITSGVVKSNVTQIDGAATNGNNATLKLKSLNLKSDSPTTYSLDINGFDGTVGNNNGGTAIRIHGGNAYPVSGDGSGGHGILLSGGTLNGAGTRGYALRASASGAGGGGGIFIDGAWGQIPLLLQGDSYTSGMKVTGGYGWIGGIEANIKGNFVGDVTGSVGSISTVRPKKNTGLDNFMFPMFDSTTKNPKTGLTVTAERAIDGNPFAPCSASAVELSNGVYRVSLSASDLNGNKIMLRFSAPGADDQLVEIITQD